MINTSCFPGTSSRTSRECRAGCGATYDRLPDCGWAVLPTRRSPKVDRCRPAHRLRRRGRRRASRSASASRRTFLLVLIIFVVTTAVADAARKRLVNEGASAALPERKGQLPGAIPQVSGSWLKRCGPGAVAGRPRGRGARRAGTADPGRGGRSASSATRRMAAGSLGKLPTTRARRDAAQRGNGQCQRLLHRSLIWPPSRGHPETVTSSV